MRLFLELLSIRLNDWVSLSNEGLIRVLNAFSKENCCGPMTYSNSMVTSSRTSETSMISPVPQPAVWNTKLPFFKWVRISKLRMADWNRSRFLRPIRRSFSLRNASPSYFVFRYSVAMSASCSLFVVWRSSMRRMTWWIWLWSQSSLQRGRILSPCIPNDCASSGDLKL